MRKDTFVQDGKVTDGKTGNILLRFQIDQGGHPVWLVVTVDGVAVLYLNPDELPVTAFFVMPSRFAEFLMQADEKPESLSLNLIRNLCSNVDFIYRKERKDLFRKASRGRRYVR